MRTSFSEDELAQMPRACNGLLVRPPGTGKRGPLRRKLTSLQQSELACRDAQAAAEQTLGEQAYRLATRCNTDIMIKLLDRFDRGHRLKAGRIEAEKDRQLRIKLAEMARDHKAGYLNL